MKKIYYCSVVTINENVYLYYNALKNIYMLLNSNKHLTYQNNSPDTIAKIDPNFYAILVENSFVIEDSIDETNLVEFYKLLTKLDTSQYHVVINTTLDCNLNCWYCYESKIVGSLLSDKVIDIIKKNIVQKYKETPYKELKISFFGGEPLINFDAIKNITLFCASFSKQKDFRLLLDFTTNATLFTEDQLLFLKDYTCYFQITLDGHEKKHNKVRFLKENKKGTYKTVVNNIHNIHNYIENSFIWIRINFDNKTLETFPEILSDFFDLDRKRVFLIIRKIWQYSSNKINEELIVKSINFAINNDFYIDNYAIPRYEPCFADRLNQVLINYDGKIFKCSTIKHFDDSNAEGILCEETGKVDWDMNKLAKKFMNRSPEKCRKCKIFPACFGPCGKNVNIVGEDFSCIFDYIGFTKEEYIMYAYKLEQLNKKLFSIPKKHNKI